MHPVDHDQISGATFRHSSVSRGELAQDIAAYREEGNAKGCQEVDAFRELKHRFAETPLNVPTILMSGHQRRFAEIEHVLSTPSTFEDSAAIDAWCVKIAEIDRVLVKSIQVSTVHRGVLASLQKHEEPETLVQRVSVGPESSLAKEAGILSDIEILERLVADDSKCVFVSPLIDPAVQLGPCSLDLRLGTEFIFARTVASTHIDLTEPREQIERQTEENFEVRNVGPDGHFVLHPGEFALASTLEHIRLPQDIAGRLEGRSSVGRLGILVHATAGFVDPGFEGPLTFELSNVGKLPVRIAPGKLRLGQICFFKTRDVQEPYFAKPTSKYKKMLGAERTRIHLDPDIGTTSPDSSETSDS